MTTNRAESQQTTTDDQPIIDFTLIGNMAEELAVLRRKHLKTLFDTYLLNPSAPNYDATMRQMLAYKTARDQQRKVNEMRHRIGTDVALAQLRHKLMGTEIRKADETG